MKNISEIAFFTDDVKGMMQFYESFLDAPPVASSEDMAIFMSGDTKIFIHRKYVPEMGELQPENHIAFTVDNVELTCKKLISQGYEIEIAGKEYYWGYSAYLRDPDGHLLELIQQVPGE